MRRAFDAVSAAIGLCLLAPLLAVLAAAVKLEDGGPVLYGHPRIGKGFRRFRLYKFRSMVPDADRVGPAITGCRDPRVTRVGRFMRRHKLDELPQLFNVLKGDIRLVGPRPEVERYVEIFRPQYEELLRDPPGITDPATLAFRSEEELLSGTEDLEKTYVGKILPRKLELSCEYARRRTFFSDLIILFKTLTGIPQRARHPGPVPGNPGSASSA
jgi:lipopolysaccharide/colanic/teichoic acid biosynthesis glycosyltransferase